MMNTLVEINAARQDGAFRYDEGIYHNYLEYYDTLFAPYRHLDINIFEVGFESGASARLWLKYFTKARVYSIDTNSNCKKVDDKRHHLTIVDIVKVKEKYLRTIAPTIAIDDGSHNIEDQIYFIKTVYPYLQEGGLMIIEDIQNIERSLHLFRDLGLPFEVLDLRKKIGRWDDVLVVLRK